MLTKDEELALQGEIDSIRDTQADHELGLNIALQQGKELGKQENIAMLTSNELTRKRPIGEICELLQVDDVTVKRIAEGSKITGMKRCNKSNLIVYAMRLDSKIIQR
jgi:hypothetical protein